MMIISVMLLCQTDGRGAWDASIPGWERQPRVSTNTPFGPHVNTANCSWEAWLGLKADSPSPTDLLAGHC